MYELVELLFAFKLCGCVKGILWTYMQMKSLKIQSFTLSSSIMWKLECCTTRILANTRKLPCFQRNLSIIMFCFVWWSLQHVMWNWMCQYMITFYCYINIVSLHINAHYYAKYCKKTRIFSCKHNYLFKNVFRVGHFYN